MPELRFTVLGPLRVWREGRELRFNRARDRAVLAVLLAAAGRPVPVGEIVDGVWGEEGDEAPDRVGALPGHVYRLRKALDGPAAERSGASVLRHEGKGYRLDVDPEAVDRTAFLAGIAEAATARRNWQPERARSLLSDALALWTGRALGDVPGPFAAHERDLLDGWREEALRHRRDLDLELSGPTGPAPGARAVRRPFQLPPDIAEFAGRQTQLAEIAEVLTGPPGPTAPLIRVTGPAGTGKSALAVHAAHRAETAYPDGQLYADLRGVGPEAVPGTLAAFVRALGVEESAVPTDPADRRALFHRMLAGRRVLVVLDGAPAVEPVRPLLPTAPGCAAIVTLAESSDPGPGPDGGHTVRLGRLSPADALFLLYRLLGPARAAREPHSARALAAACDYLPGPLCRAADLLLRRPSWSISALVPPVLGRQRCGG
ncbi:BTAD domain-containing putative transcriptional regulator [Kitasatospora sp. NPDC096077]|uniref:AfsR/SARP family transcriptional regulator n=1 Tax=Kitasatospora sp. NPDC096077 TaxID=3155544 RepID=UPI0033287BF8